MIFFVILYSGIATYLFFFFTPNYIQKIQSNSGVNFKIFFSSLTNWEPSKKPPKRCIFLFFILFCIALIALQSQRLWVPENPNTNLILCFIWIFSITQLAIVDFHTGFLPNSFTYPLWLIGGLMQLHTSESAWYLSIIPSLTLIFLGYTFHLLYLKLRRKSPFGMGDIKLLAALWVWMGTSFLVTLIFLACGLLLIFHKINKRKLQSYPFGPFLLFGVLGAHILYVL